MRTKVIGLTKKQKEVLDIIKKFYIKYKYPPSVRQIGNEIGINSPATIHVHLNGLIEKGYIKRSEYGNKAIELLVPNEYDTKSDEIVNVPLIDLNNNQDIDSELEIPHNVFSVPIYLTENKESIFAIKYNNNLVSEGILKNDIVLLERTNDINENDIVLTIDLNYNKVLVNYSYNSIIYGKVIGIYRKF